jgi:hypothetical protein
MVHERVNSVGAYFMRLVGGVAVILGVLGALAGLSQGNLIGIAFSVAFVIGGVILLKRSGRTRRTGDSAFRPGDTR